MGRSLPSLSVGSGPRAGITGYKISSPSFSLSCSLSLPVFASHIVLFCLVGCVQHLVFALASVDMRFHPAVCCFSLLKVSNTQRPLLSITHCWFCSAVRGFGRF